jgi:hypothetical protein
MGGNGPGNCGAAVFRPPEFFKYKSDKLNNVKARRWLVNNQIRIHLNLTVDRFEKKKHNTLTDEYNFFTPITTC